MVTLINMPATGFHMPRLEGVDCGNCVMIPNPLAWYPCPPKCGALRNATVAATTSATITMIIAPVRLDDRIMNPTRLDPAK
jgi:hypothetical protein